MTRAALQISALAREGLDPMVQAIYTHVAAARNEAPPDVDPRFVEGAGAADA